jgi:protein SCO1/2
MVRIYKNIDITIGGYMKKIVMLVLLFLTVLQAESLGVNEKLGEYVPLDLTFIDEEGKSRTLKEYMDGKPTIISLNYYRCGGICGPQLADMAKLFSRLDLSENTDYKVLTISFAQDETPPLAKAKRDMYHKAMSRPYVQDAWHFLLSENNSSAIIADKVGFSYKKTVTQAGVVDWIHASTLIILSPEGKITRYLNGIEQLPFDVKMAVLESAKGTVGPTIAKTLLYCFSYDPKGKTYVFAWEKIAAIVILTITILFFLWLLKAGRRDQEEHQNKRGKLDE